MCKKTCDTDREVSRTRKYTSGDLTIMVEVIGEYSKEAIDNFNRIFHQTLDETLKQKKIESSERASA